jgi:hypothetical protein
VPVMRCQLRRRGSSTLNRPVSSHRKSDVPGIPEHKLVIDTAMAANHDGWIITDIECAAAVGIWQKLVRENG